MKDREKALRDAAEDVCVYCGKRAYAYKPNVTRNERGNYVHESVDVYNGERRFALCDATPIYARLEFESQH